MTVVGVAHKIDVVPRRRHLDGIDGRSTTTLGSFACAGVSDSPSRGVVNHVRKSRPTASIRIVTN